MDNIPRRYQHRSAAEIADKSTEWLQGFLVARGYPSEYDIDLTNLEREGIKCACRVQIDAAVRLYDFADGNNPMTGPKRRYGGTPNRQSLTYKFRKLLGFSEP